MPAVAAQGNKKTTSKSKMINNTATTIKWLSKTSDGVSNGSKPHS